MACGPSTNDDQHDTNLKFLCQFVPACTFVFYCLCVVYVYVVKQNQQTFRSRKQYCFCVKRTNPSESHFPGLEQTSSTCYYCYRSSSSTNNCSETCNIVTLYPPLLNPLVSTPWSSCLDVRVRLGICFCSLFLALESSDANEPVAVIFKSSLRVTGSGGGLRA